MKNFKRIFFAVLIVCIALLYSCKESNEIGYSVLPATDTVKLSYAEYASSDGAGLFQITNELDTVRTDSSYYSLVGVDENPVFGKTKASTLFSLVPYSYDASYYLTDKIDTLVLRLAYITNKDTSLTSKNQRFYGPFVKNTKVKAYLLKNTNGYYDATKKISSNYVPQYEDQPLGEVSLVASENQTYANLYFDEEPRNRIGKILMKAYNLAQYKDFWAKFPGIYLKTDDNSGNIHIFNIAADTLRLNTNTGDTTHHELKFIYSDRCLSANVYEHSYANSKVNFTKTPSSSDQMFYIQGASGAKARIAFGNITQKLNLKSNDTAYVAKATIRIKVDAADNQLTTSNYFSVVPAFKIYIANDDGSRTNISQFVSVSSSTGLSTYSSFWMKTSGYYTIDVTSTVQAMVNGRIKQRAFYLSSAYSSYTASRIALNKNNVKLEILYSPVKVSNKN